MASQAADGEILLREADRSAERSVSIARIVTAIVLGGAIVASTEPEDLQIPHVAAVIWSAKLSLLVLFAGGIGAWLLVSAGRWRPWMAYLTVTIDIGVVAVNLWSSLRVTGLAGDFASVVPATSAVLLVLVTCALRLRPWVQAYSTALLIGSTLAIALEAGHLEFEERRLIAGDTAVLFGVTPNVVRVAMVSLAGSVLVLAAIRGRLLLMRAIEEASQRANLGRYLPAELAPVLASRRIDELKTGQRGNVALLFVDIRNSTAMEETLDTTALAAFIGQFRRHVTGAATVHRGIIDKFVGDGAFVVFGVLEVKPDDAARAIGCARDILARIAQWNEERSAARQPTVAVGLGVHFGEAFVGAIGDEARLEFTVLGDAVNVAHRLEQATKDHATPLLVSQQALAAAGEEAGDWRALGSEHLRGRSQPVVVYAPKDLVAGRKAPQSTCAGRA